MVDAGHWPRNWPNFKPRTTRWMPSFNLVTLKLIDNPIFTPDNLM